MLLINVSRGQNMIWYNTVPLQSYKNDLKDDIDFSQDKRNLSSGLNWSFEVIYLVLLQCICFFR